MTTGFDAEIKATAMGIKTISTGRARQRMWKKIIVGEGINKGKECWRQSTPLPVEEENYYRNKGWVLQPPPNIVLIDGEYQEVTAPSPSPVEVVVETSKGDGNKRPYHRKSTKRGKQ